MSDSTPTSSRDIPRLRSREGFALAMALGAIVIIGMLIAGVTFVSSQQARAGRTSVMQEQAFRAAEAGVAFTVSDWRNDSTGGLANGQTWLRTAIPIPGLPVSMRPTVRVTRLSDDLHQVLAEASAGAEGGARIEARRRVSQLVRVVGPTFNIRGALTIRNSIKIGGSSKINGHDSSPTGWGCDAPEASKPGIAIPNTSNISTPGCSNYSCVEGSPKVLSDAVAGQTDTYFKYGDFTWAELVAMADLVMPTSQLFPEPAFNADGSCKKSLYTNWGDIRRFTPQGKCETYFPIIYFPGNAKLTGGTGQGIMLIEGDLEVQGEFKFFGPVIIRGTLRTAGTGGHFNGAVMAANVELDDLVNEVLGNAVVNYSSCAVEAAVEASGRARPVIQRAWAEMY